MFFLIHYPEFRQRFTPGFSCAAPPVLRARVVKKMKELIWLSRMEVSFAN
jgi:hypothetical protein